MEEEAASDSVRQSQPVAVPHTVFRRRPKSRPANWHAGETRVVDERSYSQFFTRKSGLEIVSEDGTSRIDSP